LTSDSTPSTPPAAPSTALGSSKLDRSLMHGVAWTGAMKWATQVLSWAATLMIARILTPADYGLLTMATVYLGFVQIVNELGLGPAIIRQRDLTDEQISALGGVSLGFGLLWWILSIGFGFLIAGFYHEPVVAWIIAALGVTFVTSGLRVLPKALLTRDLRFKRVAAIDAVEAVSGTVATLVLAVMGFRYWALVWGGIAGSALSTIVALRWRPHPRTWPREFKTIAPSLLFGWHIVVSRFAWYLYTNADFAIVGRIFSKVTLGGYGFAWSLASIPVTRISSLVGQVTPAIFSAVQHDKRELRRYVLKLTEGLALITFPFSVGLALVAREFVLVVLGEQWRVAIVPLQLLAFYAGFRSITTLHPQILQFAGRARDQMRYSLIALAVMPPLFFLGGKFFAIAGVAWAWIIGYPLVMILPYRAIFQVTEITLRQYVSALMPATLASTGMAAAVLGAGLVLPDRLTPLERLAIESVLGAVTYLVMVFGFQRDRLRLLKSMLGELRR
jgi:O-antigen/teichoic acid export membrane protein